MRSSLPRLYPLIVLLVLAGTTIWLERATREEENVRAAESRSEPDFTAESARLISHHPESAVPAADRAERLRKNSIADRLPRTLRSAPRAANSVALRSAPLPGLISGKTTTLTRSNPHNAT